jgi:hypothetical protein
MNPGAAPQRALDLARAGLEETGAAPLDADATSVFLQYWLLELLYPPDTDSQSPFAPYDRTSADDPGSDQARPEKTMRRIRHAVQRLSRSPATHLPPDILAGLVWGPAFGLLKSSATYRQRLAELVFAKTLSQALAPETCLAATACSPPLGAHLHAIIYAAAPLVSHEFYPLAVDAYVRDSRCYGAPHFTLVAAHGDWLDNNGHLRRALYCDWNRQRLIESDLEPPLSPDSVHFLCLGNQDQAQRQTRWAHRLNCPQANPAAVAALADDKQETLCRWRALGLPTPASYCLNDSAEALALQLRYGDLVLKPIDGTESNGIGLVSTAAALRPYLETATFPLLAQQRCDGIVYRSLQGTRHTLSLRFNVCWNGRAYHTESAYAQIGPDLSSPSGGKDGRQLPLDQVLPNLCARLEDTEVQIDSLTLDRLYSDAEKAATAFPGLLLNGIDVLLDLDPDGKALAVFLEANPRPAGLGRSTLLSDDQPGIGAALWDGLEALARPRPLPLSPVEVL